MKLQRRIRKLISQHKMYLCFLIVLVVTAVVSLFYTRRVMLINAKSMGEELTRSYLIEEEKNFDVYKNLISMGTEFLEEYIEQGAEPEEIQQWMPNFFNKALAIVGDNTIDPYAVVNGKIIAENPWEEDEIFDYTKTEWYQKAMQANGEVIFTDAYEDAIYRKYVITIAQECGDTGNVIAFDVFPENFRVHNNGQQLPEGGSYYLCDSNGTLLYKDSVLHTDEETIRSFVQNLFEKIQTGETKAAEDYIYDLNGKRRAVYSYETASGWTGILTMPYTTLLQDYSKLVRWYVVVFLVFLVLSGLMIVRAWRLNRDVDRTNETVRILGNSYYDIYRVDFQEGKYERIKGTDYSRNNLSHGGDYQTLLRVMAELMDEETRQEFLASFSLENVRDLVKKQQKEFGGDFQRLFNGAYEWVNVRLLFDPSLEPDEIVLCFREVEIEKRGQLRQMKLLEEALDAAKVSEESQKKFFANMSHDMRTPLNAVIGMSEMALKESTDQEKVRNYLEKIHMSSKQLLSLINDILEMSRLEQGNINVENEAFSLQKTMLNLIAPFQAQAENEGKEFQTFLDIQNTEVIGDADRLSQIMNNLLSNALKFTKPNDTISVEVSQIEAKDMYQFLVRDTGAGMSKEFVPKLFTPYEREVRFGAKHVAGTGLGMPIVKSLITKMGGQIVVDSELGRGTEIRVVLPFGASDEVPEEEEKPVEAEYVLEGKKILLAEDYELNMEIATDILEMEGAVVTPAWNGREALEIFAASEEHTFDAILMDMQMPEMNGCDATEAIRKLDRKDAARIPIIAVTANAFAEDIALTKKAGMDAHISKPIDIDALCSTLGELIAQREHENE